MSGFAKALPVIAAALAAVLAPPKPLVASEWMANNLIVPDGPRGGSLWDPAMTPYVPPIVDALGPDSPHNLVVVRKSSQTGVSVAAIGLVGAYIERAPCKIGYALPTIDALHRFNAEKLMPCLTGTKALSQRVREQTSRSATGSTVTRKSFPGGSLSLLNANLAKDLKSLTLKIGVADEVDEWTADLEGQGDPWSLFQGRFTAFHASGDYRLLALSTPTLAGSSRIETLYQEGDQRLWHVECPGCGASQPLAFENLRYEPRPPHKAHYVMPCCGTIVDHWQKPALVRAGRFVPTNPEGLYPSYHVDALISQVTTWDKIAEEFIAAGSDRRRMKKFVNQTLGLPYEERGDAPDHVRLMERAEDYPENTIPPLGLLVTCGADVQHDGIWIEVVAWAPDAQSWTVSARFLAGDTTDPETGAFAGLLALYDETFEDAYGNKRRIDAMAVDAGDGGRANQVYAFTRGRNRVHAIKGMPGWSRPAIASTPTKVAITLRGKRSGAALLWPVGIYDLKATFYDNLRKQGRRAGAETDPPGYCHFGRFLPEHYYRQITAETLGDRKSRGRIEKQWVRLGPNHLHDARIYAMAMAEYLGLSRKTREQWLHLASLHGLPPAAGDLFAGPALAAERAVPPPDETVGAALARSVAGKRAAAHSGGIRRRLSDLNG